MTHDQEEALAISDSIAVMNRGRVVRFGIPWEIYYKLESTFVADFIEVANFIKGKALQITFKDILVDIGHQILRLDKPIFSREKSRPIASLVSLSVTG